MEVGSIGLDFGSSRGFRPCIAILRALNRPAEGLWPAVGKCGAAWNQRVIGTEAALGLPHAFADGGGSRRGQKNGPGIEMPGPAGLGGGSLALLRWEVRHRPYASHHEQPVVEPQVSHFRQVPLRTRVKLAQLGQGSPS